MRFTVLVITYNSDWNKLRLTLESIVRQKMEDYEIVIADDASQENHFDKIQQFFAAHGFADYHLVGNETNQGTVKNLLSGLSRTSGKYVKFIGAGDALYEEQTLQKVYDFMEENQYECCFGLMQGFQRKHADSVVKVPFCHPFDMDAYRQNKQDKVIRNLVLYSDNTCGASLCYRTDFAIEYMNRIQADVVYEEDIFQVLSAVEGRQVRLFDDYIVWYEVSAGVSAKGHSRFAELLKQDTARFYARLYHEHGSNRYVKKRYQLRKVYKIDHLYLRTFLRFFVNPGALIYVANTMLQRKRGVHGSRSRTEGFLDREEFLQSLQE